MTDCACDICEMKKYYTKVFNIIFLSKADCPARKLCPYDSIKESTKKKKGDGNAE